jgi:hypothetical protein
MARRFIKIDDPSKDTPRAFSDIHNPYMAELLRTLALVYQAAATGATTYDSLGRILTVTVTGLTLDGEGNAVTATITYTYDDASGTSTGVPDALWKEQVQMDFDYDRDSGVVTNSIKILTTYTYGTGNRIDSYARTEV